MLIPLIVYCFRRYSRGDSPSIREKNLLKAAWSEKWRWSDIWAMLILLVLSRKVASIMRNWFTYPITVRPVSLLTTRER